MLPDNLHQTPIFQWSGWIFGLIGIVLAVVFYVLSRKEKRPWWTISSNNIIKGFAKKVPGLEIKFGNTEVENLTVSKIIFWNAGRETINGADISQADPLRIVAHRNAQLLDVKILKENRLPSRFLISAKPDESEFYVCFDFLDRDWGTVIQVVHTGSKSNDIELTGSIRGSSGPTHKNRNSKSRRAMAREFKALLIFSFMMIIATPTMST